MLLRSTLVTVAVLAMPMLAVPAHAQTVSRSVSYADLNLASASGSAALDSRVASAAAAVCAPEEHLNLKQRSEAAQCKQQTLAAGRSTAQAVIANHQSDTQVAAASKGRTAVR